MSVHLLINTFLVSTRSMTYPRGLVSAPYSIPSHSQLYLAQISFQTCIVLVSGRNMTKTSLLQKHSGSGEGVLCFWHPDTTPLLPHGRYSSLLPCKFFFYNIKVSDCTDLSLGSANLCSTRCLLYLMGDKNILCLMPPPHI